MRLLFCAALRRALAAAAAPLLLDATLGNGHDCAFLLRCAPEHSLLLGLDVQPQALDAARARLAGISRPDVRVQFFCQGHEHLARLWETLPREDLQRPLMAAVFNLGWLPGGDKTCLTQAATTVAALDALVPRLAPQRNLEQTTTGKKLSGLNLPETENGKLVILNFMENCGNVEWKKSSWLPSCSLYLP